MGSFGDYSTKTRIEEELRWIATQFYSVDFFEDKEVQRRFILDVLDVLRYMCDE